MRRGNQNGILRASDTTADPYINLLIAVIRQAQQDAIVSTRRVRTAHLHVSHRQRTNQAQQLWRRQCRQQMQQDARDFLEWCRETAPAGMVLDYYEDEYERVTNDGNG